MKRLRITALTIGTAWTSAAFAQPAQTPPAPDANQITDIIVTASRRSEVLQRAAIPVTAVSGRDLSKAGVTRAEDLARVVAGVQISGSGVAPMVYLRGVGTFAAPRSDSSILSSIDGVVAGLPPMLTGVFYDIQRVEVLKGPQGTLYGRNATGGAINIISNQPTDRFGGYGEVEIGNYGLVSGEGALNVPVSDQLAVRAAVKVISRDGYFTDGAGDDKSQSLRLQALYKPNDRVSLLLGGDYERARDNPGAYVPVPFVDSDNPWTGPSTTLGNASLAALGASGNGTSIQPGTPIPLITSNGYSDVDNWGLRAELNWNLGFAKLTTITAYRHLKTNELFQPGFPISDTFTARQATGEARLASLSSGPLRWLVGAFYYDLKDHTPSKVDNGFSVQTNYTKDTSKSWAGFGDLTYSLTDRFRVTGGLRYTTETRTIDLQATTSVYIGQGPTGPIYTPPATFTAVGSQKFSNVTGKAGIEYDVGPHSLFYATYSTGFRAGGFNSDIAPNVYKPEKLTAYTIGSKNRFFDNHLQINAELFYWDYRNKQENILAVRNAGGYSITTRNIGAAVDKGVSVETQLRATRNDVFTAQAEYLDTRYKDFKYVSPLPIAAVAPTTTCTTTRIAPDVAPPPFLPLEVTGTTQVDCSGKPFIRAPKWTVIAGYQHSFPLARGARVTASVNAKYASASYIATDYIPSERQGSYILTDLNLGYESANGRWSVTGFVRNAGNVAVLTAGFQHPYITGLTYSTLNAPRTFGVKLRTEF